LGEQVSVSPKPAKFPSFLRFGGARFFQLRTGNFVGFGFFALRKERTVLLRRVAASNSFGVLTSIQPEKDEIHF